MRGRLELIFWFVYQRYFFQFKDRLEVWFLRDFYEGEMFQEGFKLRIVIWVLVFYL